MEYERLQKKIDWLDEERRKDQTRINSIGEQLNALENNQSTHSKQIKDQAGEVARIGTLNSRLEGIDEELIKNITDFKIFGDYIYMICGEDGIFVYDLAVDPLDPNPSSADAYPIIPKDNDDNNSHVYDVFKYDDNLFIAAGNEGIKVYS